MKSAEEWIKEDMPSLPDVAIQPYAKWVRAIQLDSWKQGMTDAAMLIAGGTNHDSNAILKARDAKTEL